MRRFKERPGPLLGLAMAVVLGLGPLSLWAQETQVPGFLTLSDAVDIALSGSTQIGRESAQLDATRSGRMNAWFSLGPSLTLNASTTKQTRTDLAFDRDVFIDSTGTFDVEPVPQSKEESGFRSASLNADILLFDGGANWYRIAAANRDVDSSELSLAYTQTTVTEGVIEAYYNLLRAKLLLRVSREAETVSLEQLQRTEALYDLGSAARSDVLKSQVQLGQTRLELVQARNRQRQAHDDLVFAMNLIEASPFDIDTTIVDIPSIDVDFDSLKDSALDNRLDLLSLRESERAESHRVKAAYGGLFPTVSFRYNISRSHTESQFRFGAPDNRTRSWSFSGSWNLFDRWQTYSNISNARAQRRIAEYNRKQTELDVVREIRTHVNSIVEAQERLAVAKENVKRSEEDLRLAQEKFRVGAGTILDTITAESDLTSTKGEEVQAVVDFLIARAKLARATGEPFEDL